jgi:DNA-binding PadR family transcriptional regulator
MLEQGLIEDCDAPEGAPTDARERNYYAITPRGREALTAEAARLASYVDAAREKQVLSGHA